MILAVGYVGSRGGSGGGSSSDGYDESGYSESALAELSRAVTVNRLQDPWVPGSAGVVAASGRRLVALEVTVEGPRGCDTPVYVSPMSFKLTDSDGYAYAAFKSEGARPPLATISLKAGEKTRGWLTFEVDESTRVSSVSYRGVDLKLP
ncbi:MAG TPA: DUF4352 domain-containing protein [Dehalococcoidia bacterium]|nr:DUF4352 domain-containing protein [Dehalococcoidia bacterium]